jgi:hypothetical protein
MKSLMTLKRTKPKEPGWPIVGMITAEPGLSNIVTLEDPYIFKPFMVNSIEWPWTKTKIPGVTAIPSGTYRVYLTMSPRFGRVLPLLVGVQGFDGIRMHRGISQEHTSGCLVVGKSEDMNGRAVGGAEQAENEVISWLRAREIEKSEVWIQIIDPQA